MKPNPKGIMFSILIFTIGYCFGGKEGIGYAAIVELIILIFTMAVS